MTVRRHLGRCFWPLVLALPLAGLVLVSTGKAADTPVGKVIADILPANNRLRPKEQILALMQSRPGRAYDEGLIQEDVRKLQATKWFTPGGVQIHTRPDAEGRVLVFVYVTEVTNTVQEVVYDGVEHINKGDLATLAGVRKGDPMNPLTNELGRAAILRRLLGRRPGVRQRRAGRGRQGDRHPRRLPRRRGAGGQGRRVRVRGQRLRRHRPAEDPAGHQVGVPRRARRQVQPDEPGRGPAEAHRVLPRPRLPAGADLPRGGPGGGPADGDHRVPHQRGHAVPGGVAADRRHADGREAGAGPAGDAQGRAAVQRPPGGGRPGADQGLLRLPRPPRRRAAGGVRGAGEAGRGQRQLPDRGRPAGAGPDRQRHDQRQRGHPGPGHLQPAARPPPRPGAPVPAAQAGRCPAGAAGHLRRRQRRRTSTSSRATTTRCSRTSSCKSRRRGPGSSWSGPG